MQMKYISNAVHVGSTSHAPVNSNLSIVECNSFAVSQNTVYVISMLYVAIPVCPSWGHIFHGAVLMNQYYLLRFIAVLLMAQSVN